MKIKFLNKIMVGSLIISIIVCSCKKSNPSSYYISFDVNGSTQTFRTKTSCKISSNPSVHNYWFTLNGFNEDSSNYIYIAVYSPSPINTTNIYVDTADVVNQDIIVNLYEFDRDLSGTTLLSSGYAGYPNGVNVKFKDITSTYVSGSFSGNVAVYSRGTVSKITNGTFYLPVK